jgi:hypothetical protein
VREELRIYTFFPERMRDKKKQKERKKERKRER